MRTLSLKRVFINSLLNKVDSRQKIKLKNESFRRAFLKIASSTQENMRCLERVEYGLVAQGEQEQVSLGPKLKNKSILVSEILNALEDVETPPAEIKEYYPDLSDEEWQAALRLVTVIVFSLEEHLDVDSHADDAEKSKVRKLIHKLLPDTL